MYNGAHLIGAAMFVVVFLLCCYLVFWQYADICKTKRKAALHSISMFTCTWQVRIAPVKLLREVLEKTTVYSIWSDKELNLTHKCIAWLFVQMPKTLNANVFHAVMSFQIHVNMGMQWSVACALPFIGREVVGKIKLIWRQQIWLECQILFLFVFIASRQFQISDDFLPTDSFFYATNATIMVTPLFSFKSLGCTVKLSHQKKKEFKRTTVLLSNCFPKFVDVCFWQFK